MLLYLYMIRTTVRLEEELFKDARKRAIDERVAFTQVINEALCLYLEKPRQAKKKITGTEFLGKLVELSKKYKFKGPKDLAKNHDKYLWEQFGNH